MTKLIKFLGNNIIALVTAIAFISLLSTQFGSCGNTAKLNQKIGALKISIESHNVLIKDLQKENKQLLDSNKVLIESVKELKEKSIETNKKLSDNAQKIKDLQSNRPNYAEECKPIVQHMQKEIDAITSSFNLAIYDRDTWMQIAHNNELGWKNETKIRINIEDMAKMISSDSKLKDDVIKELQKNLKARSIEATIAKSGLITVLALMIIYGIAK